MPRSGTLRAILIVSFMAFVSTEGAALAAGSLLRARLDGLQVIVIGSGRSLSVLVTAGEARLLLATGDDTTAFGNGWRRWAGFLPTLRVDVLLLADDSAVGASITDRVHSRWTAAIANPTLVQPERHVPPLRSPIRFRLGDEVRVTVESAVESDPTADASAWRMVVERGRTVISVIPNGAAAAKFNWPTPVAALVILDGVGLGGAVAAVRPRAIIVPHAIEGRTLRADVPPVLVSDAWSLRLPPGEIARLSFVESGLRIPSDAVLLTPVPATAQTSTRPSELRPFVRTPQRRTPSGPPPDNPDP